MQTNNLLTGNGITVMSAFKIQMLNSSKGKFMLRNDKEGAFNTLFNYIQRYSNTILSDQDKEQIRQACKMKLLKRRQYLLQQGDVCKYVSFIVRGAMRMYSINERGQEAIISFGLEENWVTDQESLTLQLPSLYNIEAVEVTELLMIPLSQLQLLSNIVPAVDQMVNLNHREQTITTQRRIYAAISMTAEERYQYMLACNPEYMQRFSQNMVAAYLGIKPETLSRVRTKIDHDGYPEAVRQNAIAIIQK
jgi:CRP/FNR family transcriptional regulator, anaerobic regulatory protein